MTSQRHSVLPTSRSTIYPRFGSRREAQLLELGVRFPDTPTMKTIRSSPMSILNKPLQDITFDDVVAFCGTGEPEDAALEYKADFPNGLERTHSAFANTTEKSGFSRVRLGGVAK